MKCQVCDAEMVAGANFCPRCGAKVPSLEAPGATATAGPATVAADDPNAAAPAAGAGTFGRRRNVSDVPEETLWEGGYSPKAMLGTFVGLALISLLLIVLAVALREFGFWSILLLAFVMLIWLIALGQLLYRRLSVHYKLTNQMLYHQSGILTRTMNRIEAIDIDDVTWEQGLFDRVVNVGNVTLSSSDKTDRAFVIRGVANVEEVARTIDKARRAERLRRGVSVESL